MTTRLNSWWNLLYCSNLRLEHIVRIFQHALDFASISTSTRWLVFTYLLSLFLVLYTILVFPYIPLSPSRRCMTVSHMRWWRFFIQILAFLCASPSHRLQDPFPWKNTLEMSCRQARDRWHSFESSAAHPKVPWGGASPIRPRCYNEESACSTTYQTRNSALIKLRNGLIFFSWPEPCVSRFNTNS